MFDHTHLDLDPRQHAHGARDVLLALLVLALFALGASSWRRATPDAASEQAPAVTESMACAPAAGGSLPIPATPGC